MFLTLDPKGLHALRIFMPKSLKPLLRPSLWLVSCAFMHFLVIFLLVVNTQWSYGYLPTIQELVQDQWERNVLNQPSPRIQLALPVTKSYFDPVNSASHELLTAVPSPSWSSFNPIYIFVPVRTDAQAYIDAPGILMPDWTFRGSHWNSLTPSEKDSYASTIIVDSASGWPWPSVRGRLFSDMSVSSSNYLELKHTFNNIIIFALPTWWPDFIPWIGSCISNYPYYPYVFLFPTRVMWYGFLLNSLIYLCIIGFADLAILSPAWRHAGRPALGHLRSWRRRRRVVRLADRRGLCPTCTHPLVPATADPASGSTRPRRCTECGWTDTTPTDPCHSPPS